jgi:hypothetical protein
MNFKDNNNQWYNDPKYDLFWSNYKSSSVLNDKFINYSTLMIKASRAAHISARLAMMNHYDKKRHLNIITAQQEKEQEPIEEETRLEFEISDDMLKFYEKSFVYKREKSKKKFSSVFIICDLLLY